MKIRTKASVIIVVAVLFLCPGATAAKEGKSPPHEPGDRDKCPVCGMMVKKFPKWASQIIFKDGTFSFFDGPKDMFKYYLEMKKYNPNKTQKDISSIWVKDYYSLNWIEAREAFFVEGSDVTGPMGKELIPISQEWMAQQFIKDHGGGRILRFDEVNRALIEGMR